MVEKSPSRIWWNSALPLLLLQSRQGSEMQRERLGEARLQAHYAVQWLGRAGGAFIRPESDYGHTSMNWEGGILGFATNPMKGGVRLGLAIPDLAFVLLDATGKRLAAYELNGRTDGDVRQWIGNDLAARGMDAGRLDKIAPYEIPPHRIANGGAYRRDGIAEELRALARCFADAHAALEAVRRQAKARSLSASPVRCWPHHFDLATLVSLDEAKGEEGRSVNAGLSPGDEHYAEPYYYVSPHPYPDPSRLSRLRSGHWHTRGFTAAIALAREVADAENRKGAAQAFLDDAVQTSIMAFG
jgi:hypothetical protein